jgi:histidine triad (HIT) family protein
MYGHAPPNYQNPFARIVQGVEDENTLTYQSDVFHRDATLTAFVAISRPPKAPISTLVVPNETYENLYDIPDHILCTVHCFTKRLALALKGVLKCDGVTIRQHNEPAGGQDVWHYHVHVIPRFDGDAFHEEAWRPAPTTPEERAPWARELERALTSKS